MIRAGLVATDEGAQNGRGVKRAPRRISKFLCCLGARSRALCALTTPMLMLGQAFSFVVGSPVASQDFHFKMAAFVFRTEGCNSQSTPHITATAEGIVTGQRQSVTLKVISGTKPGVYAVTRTWPTEGDWVVNLKGSCADLNAGALVPVGPKGFIRESTKFFPHPPTESEIETSLKQLEQGGK